MLYYSEYKNNLKWVNVKMISSYDLTSLEREKNFLFKSYSNRYYLSLDDIDKKNGTYQIPYDVKSFIKKSTTDDIVDIDANYVYLKNKKIKIGRYLQYLSNPNNNTYGKKMDVNPLLKSYNDSKSIFLENRNNLILVISSHPYDIIGCSTRRRWTSCLDIEDFIWNKQYINQLSFILSPIIYIIDKSDLNINNPYSRFNLNLNNKLESKGIYNKGIYEYVSYIYKTLQKKSL